MMKRTLEVLGLFTLSQYTGRRAGPLTFIVALVFLGWVIYRSVNA
jgi:hypothetical protein